MEKEKPEYLNLLAPFEDDNGDVNGLKIDAMIGGVTVILAVIASIFHAPWWVYTAITLMGGGAMIVVGKMMSDYY